MATIEMCGLLIKLKSAQSAQQFKMKLKSKKSKLKSKSKKKSKAEVKTDKDQLSEVDKTFYELQIADLTRKLTRLTNLSLELEQRNDALNTNNRHLDEDRADVIAYLKKTVQKQADEIEDLVGRLEALKATLNAENTSFQLQLTKKDEIYQEMETELKSEINLLEGKLNALEEFRLQREELNQKFEDQGASLLEQEKTHSEAMYAIERKFIIDKDTLIRQMEDKLRTLANDYQNITDMRITESTHRMIRENIAVNNELSRMAEEHKSLYNENKKLQKSNREFRIQKELFSQQNKLAVDKCNILKGIVNEITIKYEDMRKQQERYKHLEDIITSKETEIKAFQIRMNEMKIKTKDLKLKLKETDSQKKSLLSELSRTNAKATFLTNTLFEAIFNIRQFVRLRRGITDEAPIEEEINLSNSEEIMKELYNMFLNAKEAERECKDLESWVKFYETGCAGFVPRPRSLKDITEKNIGTQVGVSFDEFIAADISEDFRKLKNSISTDSDASTNQSVPSFTSNNI